MNAIHFFNTHYGVPILKEFFARKPQEIKKDYRREISFDKLAPMINAYDPNTTSMADAIGIARMSMSAKIDYKNTEKVKGEKGKFIRTGNWVDVQRNHFPKGGDGFNWLIITEQGYWANVRNLSNLTHLGWDMSLLPFTDEHAPETALFKFFKDWDGQSPFLVIELITGLIDVDKLSLSYDARHVVINSDRNRTMNLSNLYNLAKESEVNHA